MNWWWQRRAEQRARAEAQAARFRELQAAFWQPREPLVIPRWQMQTVEPGDILDHQGRQCVPVVTLPEGFSEADLAWAQETVRKLKVEDLKTEADYHAWFAAQQPPPGFGLSFPVVAQTGAVIDHLRAQVDDLQARLSQLEAQSQS